MNFWVILIVYSTACAILCSVVADAKNRDSGGWGFAGFLFGVLALIAIAGMPSEVPQAVASPSATKRGRSGDKPGGSQRDEHVSKRYEQFFRKGDKSVCAMCGDKLSWTGGLRRDEVIVCTPCADKYDSRTEG